MQKQKVSRKTLERMLTISKLIDIKIKEAEKEYRDLFGYSDDTKFVYTRLALLGDISEYKRNKEHIYKTFPELSKYEERLKKKEKQ